MQTQVAWMRAGSVRQGWPQEHPNSATVSAELVKWVGLVTMELS